MSISIVLVRIYGDKISANYSTTLSSLAFAGTVVGMLTFGYLSDKLGRKFGMVRSSGSVVGAIAQLNAGRRHAQMLATGIVALFSALSAASSGAHHSVGGLVAMLSACR